jgi:hypothetical protein
VYIYAEQCIQEIANYVTSLPVSDLYLTHRSCLICNLHVPEKSYSKTVPVYPIPETEEIFLFQTDFITDSLGEKIIISCREIHLHKTTENLNIRLVQKGI